MFCQTTTFFFFLNDPPPTEISPLPLHAALPISPETPKEPTPQVDTADLEKMLARANEYSDGISREVDRRLDKMDKRFNRMAAMSSAQSAMADRKSTRLNSSHGYISYAVFCLQNT